MSCMLLDEATQLDSHMGQDPTRVSLEERKSFGKLGSHYFDGRQYTVSLFGHRISRRFEQK